MSPKPQNPKTPKPRVKFGRQGIDLIIKIILEIMTSPNNPSPKKSPSENFTFSRSYTTGGKLGARQMFVFNEDGTIAGLK